MQIVLKFMIILPQNKKIVIKSRTILQYVEDVKVHQHFALIQKIFHFFEIMYVEP
jgi:hypothetical protein